MVLAFRGRTMDIPTKEKILIAMPGLKEDARHLADNYKISVIEAMDSIELTERLREKLLSITKERESLKAEAHALEEIMREMDEEEGIEKDEDEIPIIKDKRGDELPEGLRILLKLSKGTQDEEDSLCNFRFDHIHSRHFPPLPEPRDHTGGHLGIHFLNILLFSLKGLVVKEKIW